MADSTDRREKGIRFVCYHPEHAVVRQDGFFGKHKCSRCGRIVVRDVYGKWKDKWP